MFLLRFILWELWSKLDLAGHTRNECLFYGVTRDYCAGVVAECALDAVFCLGH
jgi:hypothetical protein